MSNPKKRKKTGIGLLLIILIVFGLGFLYYQQDNSKKETPKEVPKKAKKDELSLPERILNGMTNEEKIGQLFLVRYSKESTSKWTSLYPGGYLLFAKDFEQHTKESITNELTSLQEKQKYPLIIAVDEEGGYVTRVSRFPAFRQEKFASPRYYYETGGYELLEQTEKEKAELLTSLGINLNLAPVADVSTNPNDFINNAAYVFETLKE